MKTTFPRFNFSILHRVAIIAGVLTPVFGPEQLLAQRPLGVDVSTYQGTGINWTSVRNSGKTFAWAKATESTTITDNTFVGNENNGKAAGVYMGGYHFAHPNLHAPGTEAGYFWGVAGGYIKADGKTLMPMLDMEVFSGVTGASSYSDWANQWNTTIVNNAHASGVVVKPAIYTSACSACNFNSSVGQWLSDVADYNGQNAQTSTPWTTCGNCAVWGAGVWTAWQYSSTGSVPGISGNVDSDVFNGNSAQLVSTFVATAPSSGLQPAAGYTWAGVNANGTVELFLRNSDNTIWHDWQITPSAAWSGWAPIDPSTTLTFSSTPAVGRNLDGRLEVFAINASTMHLMHKWQTTPSGGWSGWFDISTLGLVGKPAVAQNQNGVLEVFVLGSNGLVYHLWESAPNDSVDAWGVAAIDPSTTLTFNSSCAAARNSDGRLEVFCINAATTHVMHKWQTLPSGNWSGWFDITNLGLVGDPAVGANLNGVLEVIVRGNNNLLYHVWESHPGDSVDAWGVAALDPSTTLTFTADPAVSFNADGRLEVFALNSSSTHLMHKWQTTPSGAWSGYFDLNTLGLDGTPAAVRNQNGVVEVFARGHDGAIYHDWQQGDNDEADAWFSGSLGGNFPVPQ